MHFQTKMVNIGFTVDIYLDRAFFYWHSSAVFYEIKISLRRNKAVVKK